ncbi:MAG: heme lyase CcmF/NrfE family subunit, partial [Candidatus Rokuibacteriota bacterium]
MKAALGVMAVAAGTGAAAVGVCVLATGLARGNVELLRLGRRFVFAVLAAAIAAALVMEWALLTHDFSIEYVAENNARATPLLYTITGLWAALEGSILLWGLVLAGYLAVVAYRFRDRATDPLVAWALITGLVVALFFFGLMLGPANPFRTIEGAVPVDGAGPNPLLQNHPLMAFHPPMLYLGYVGFTVPFCFAVAALVTGRFGEGWLEDTRRYALVAFGFLTAGIILGSWWSYEVLGWGGYWAWDPVENAALLPWLTATAFIHSSMVAERRGTLRIWAHALVIATFVLTLVGTFLTRSGVVESVHSFTISAIGPWFAAAIVLTMTAALGLLVWRLPELADARPAGAAVSREGAFLFNNVLFLGITFVVLFGTLYPLVVDAVSGERISVAAPWFNRVNAPLFVALLFLMGVGPALPWGGASWSTIRDRFALPVLAAAGALLGGWALGLREAAPLAAIGLAAFVVVVMGDEVVRGARARVRSRGEAPPAAAWRLATR